MADQTEETKPVPVREKQIAFYVSDPEKFALLKKIANSVNKRSTKEPKKNCKHCKGRGFIGYLNGLKSSKVPCRCVFVKPILGIRKHV